MCGLAGYFVKTPSREWASKIPVLAQRIAQRGPDDEGVCLISRKNKLFNMYKTDRTVAGVKADYLWQSASILAHDVALVHSRYSIIDLTSGGHQPFISADASVALVFNGEIYNYIELRDELTQLGRSFRTHSDTEVLTEGYRVWGHKIWEKLNGFWAVALYDFTNGTLTLSRDRIGIAPLYYRETEEGIYFASSIQALVDIDRKGITINQDRVVGFMHTSLKDFDDTTVYDQVKSISPGSAVILDGSTYSVATARTVPYWQLPQSRLSIKDLSLEEAVKQYRDIFFNAVDLRLRADVKVAFELSGGLDSSSVVAVGAMLRNQNITTYTIQVPEENEEPYARSILQRYGNIDYRVLTDPEDDFVLQMGQFNKILEEPFHSPNLYTHYKMRQKMKADGFDVVVTGGGGDEVLAGYDGEFWPGASVDLRKNGHFLHSLRHGMAREFRMGGMGRRFISQKARMKRVLSGNGKNVALSVLKKIINKWFWEREGGVNGDHQLLTQAERFRREYCNLTFQEQCSFHFTIGLIPYYMRSNDKFTMAIPLEHRFPFFDYRVVELGLQMPVPYLFKDGWTKYILRKAMEPYLPPKILWRKRKMGFPFPYKRFLMKHSEVFQPLVNKWEIVRYVLKEYGGYNQLLDRDPTKLWRLCSTALWLDGLEEIDQFDSKERTCSFAQPIEAGDFSII